MVVGRPVVVTIPEYQIDNLRDLIRDDGRGGRAGGGGRGGTPMRSAAAALAALALLATPPRRTAGPHRRRNGYAVIAVDGATRALRAHPVARELPAGDGRDVPARARRTRPAAGPAPRLGAREGGAGRAGPALRGGPRVGARCGPAPPRASSWWSTSRAAVEVRDLRIQDDLFDVLGADYHTLARIDAAGRDHAVRVRRRDARGARRPRGAAAAASRSFVLLGIEHILSGWDHLLFLLVLLLRGGGWLSLRQDHHRVHARPQRDPRPRRARRGDAARPARGGGHRALDRARRGARTSCSARWCARRWLVSFGFGLVHGFGFSSVLREVGLPTQGLVLVAPRVQRRRRGRAGPGRGGGAARAGAAAANPVGARAWSGVASLAILLVGVGPLPGAGAPLSPGPGRCQPGGPMCHA